MLRANGLAATLRNRDFRYLFLGQLISQMGDIFILMAVLINLRRLSDSQGALAILVISFSLPTLIFGLIGGVFIDRLNRKAVMIASDVLRAAFIPLALLVQSPDMIWLYYVLAFLIATIGVFFIPARNASIPNLVPHDQLLAANSLIQFTQVAAIVGGAAIAGYTISLTGANFAFLFDSFTFLLSAGFVLLMRLPRRPPNAHKASRQVLWQQMKEGLVFIRRHRILTYILACAGVATLGITAVTVLGVAYLDEVLGPLYDLDLPKSVEEIALSVARAEQGFEANRRLSVQLGILTSVMGLGMVLGTLLVGAFGPKKRDGHLVSAGMTLMGLSILAFALAPNFGLVLLSAAIVGVTVVVARSSLATLTQRLVPDEKRGRVESVVNIAIGVSTVLSTGLLGWLSELIGVRAVFIIAALLTLSVALAAFFILRKPAPSKGGPQPTDGVTIHWQEVLEDDRLAVEREGM
ncbi:MAG: MFS transporter [Anaerolineae bacterium]